MDELRLSLIVIGIAIVGGVYMIGRMVERSRAPRQPEIQATPSAAVVAGPDFKMQIEDDAELKFEPMTSLPPAFVVSETPTPIITARPPEVTPPPIHVAPREPDLIVSLTLLARDGQKFTGTELHTALQAAGLELAEFDIYHFRDADAGGDKRAVFSVANIVKPGSFDAQALAELTTPGLAFFMQIPGPMSASEAFDTMLEKAQYIAQSLHGIIGDEQRTPLSPQRMRAIRETTLNHDLAHTLRTGASVKQPFHQPH